MITDLGLHTEGHHLNATRQLSTEDIEVRRRVFWTAFGSYLCTTLPILTDNCKKVLDKSQSVYQGRPARLQEAHNRTPIRFLDEYEELEPFHTIGYSYDHVSLDCPTYGVSTFEQLCKLSIIMDRVLLNLYAERSCVRRSEDLLQVLKSLQADLEHWRKALPPHLLSQLEDPPSCPTLPHVVSLL